MSFRSKDLNRLSQLGRQLPKELPKSTSSSKKNSEHDEKQKISEKKTPEDLFKELIESSQDGGIHPELLSKLKEIERTSISKEYEEVHNGPNKLIPNNRNKKSMPKNTLIGKSEEERNLYTSFERLLLEEDDH